MKLIETRAGRLLLACFLVLGAMGAYQVFVRDGVGRVVSGLVAVYCMVLLTRLLGAGIREDGDGIVIERLFGRTQRVPKDAEPSIQFRSKALHRNNLVIVDRDGNEFATDFVMARPELEPGLVPPAVLHPQSRSHQ